MFLRIWALPGRGWLMVCVMIALAGIILLVLVMAGVAIRCHYVAANWNTYRGR
jgi:nitrogen fixation protein FixH